MLIWRNLTSYYIDFSTCVRVMIENRIKKYYSYHKIIVIASTSLNEVPSHNTLETYLNENLPDFMYKIIMYMENY